MNRWMFYINCMLLIVMELASPRHWNQAIFSLRNAPTRAQPYAESLAQECDPSKRPCPDLTNFDDHDVLVNTRSCNLDADFDAFSDAGAGFGRKAKTEKAQRGEADAKSGVLKPTKSPRTRRRRNGLRRLLVHGGGTHGGQGATP